MGQASLVTKWRRSRHRGRFCHQFEEGSGSSSNLSRKIQNEKVLRAIWGFASPLPLLSFWPTPFSQTGFLFLASPPGFPVSGPSFPSALFSPPLKSFFSFFAFFLPFSGFFLLSYPYPPLYPPLFLPFPPSWDRGAVRSPPSRFRDRGDRVVIRGHDPDPMEGIAVKDRVKGFFLLLPSFLSLSRSSSIAFYPPFLWKVFNLCIYFIFIRWLILSWLYTAFPRMFLWKKFTV